MVGANPFFTFFDEKQPEKSLSALSREQNADFPKYFEKTEIYPSGLSPARPRREAGKIRAGRAIFVAAAAALLAIGRRSGRLGIFGGRLG